MRWTPHALVEGCAIGAYAIGAETAYIYIRGEFTEPLARHGARRSRKPTPPASSARTRWARASAIDVHVHKGAGAYICGEETALMNSLEGRRGNPRIKPPFPAVSGVFGMPTTINNVETLSPPFRILMNGADWYKKMSLSTTRRARARSCIRSAATSQRPGTYEVVMGFPFKDFLYDVCGGPLHGRKFKAVIPGGVSVPIQTMEEAEASLMDYEGFVAQGIDARLRRRDRDRRCADHGHASSRGIARFFAHESCAQCTQCREGTAWTTKILERIGDGRGNDRRSGHAARHRRADDGQDDLRAERFLRDAGRLRNQEVPRRFEALIQGTQRALVSSRRWPDGAEHARWSR